MYDDKERELEKEILRRDAELEREKTLSDPEFPIVEKEAEEELKAAVEVTSEKSSRTQEIPIFDYLSDKAKQVFNRRGQSTVYEVEEQIAEEKMPLDTTHPPSKLLSIHRSAYYAVYLGFVVEYQDEFPEEEAGREMAKIFNKLVEADLVGWAILAPCLTFELIGKAPDGRFVYPDGKIAAMYPPTHMNLEQLYEQVCKPEEVIKRQIVLLYTYEKSKVYGKDIQKTINELLGFRVACHEGELPETLKIK